MLADAVKQLSEEEGDLLPDIKQGPDPRDVKVDVAVDAMLPTNYITDAPERVELYRRLSRAKAPEEVQELRDELEDRFGKLPQEASSLLHIVETQTLAAQANVMRVDMQPDAVFLEFSEEWGGDDFGENIARMLRRLDGMPVELKGSQRLGLKVSLDGCGEWDACWKRLRKVMDALV